MAMWKWCFLQEHHVSPTLCMPSRHNCLECHSGAACEVSAHIRKANMWRFAFLSELIRDLGEGRSYMSVTLGRKLCVERS